METIIVNEAAVDIVCDVNGEAINGTISIQPTENILTDNLIANNDIVIDIDQTDTPVVDEPRYKNLVLSGGGAKGISHIGAIKKLIDEKLLDLSKLKSVAGTSVGSILGILIVLGFTIDEIWDFIYCLDINNLVKPDFLMFLSKCGIESGRIIYNLIEEIITKKTNIKHINFRQLYEITKIHFIVVGACLTTKETVYYDYVNTPNFKVSMAIRISIGIPGFFTPITIGVNKYVDGGVLNDYPMNLYDDKLDETIGIRISDHYNTDYKYPEEYFTAIVNLFLYSYHQKDGNQYENNTITVTNNIKSINVFSFDVDNNTKQQLYDHGVEACEKFIEAKRNIN